MGLGFWTDERVEKLKRMAREGLSASKIAERFGGGCTRNAVIGKIFRMGLMWADSSPKARARKSTSLLQVRRQRAKPVRTDENRETFHPVKYGPQRDKAMIAADNWKPAPEVVPPVLVTLADWPDDKCRWPYAGWLEPVSFGCTCERLPGLPYCESHSRRAFATLTVKRPLNPTNQPAKQTEDA